MYIASFHDSPPEGWRRLFVVSSTASDDGREHVVYWHTEPPPWGTARKAYRVRVIARDAAVPDGCVSIRTLALDPRWLDTPVGQHAPYLTQNVIAERVE